MSVNPVGVLLTVALIVLLGAVVFVGLPYRSTPTVGGAFPVGLATPTAVPVYQVLLLTQPTATPRPLPPPGPVASVNQRINVGGLVFEVKSPRLVSFSTLGLAEQPSRSVLVFEVLQECYRQDRRSHYGPEGFLVRDSDDFEYRAQPQPLDPVRGLKSGDLGFGERVRGEVYVVVPTGAKGFTLLFYVTLSSEPGDYTTGRVALGV